MEPLNPPPSPTSIANRRIRLQSGSEKFCEILLHNETLQVIIVQGDLVDGQKVHPTFVKNAYDCSSYDVANEYILELVNDKLDEGFDLVLDEELDSQDRVNEDKDDDSSLSFKDVQDFLHHVEVEGLELDNGKENKVVMTRCVKQDSSEVEEVEKEGKISPIQNIKEDKQIREEEEEKKLEKDNSRGPLIQKELTLSGHMKTYASIIEEEADRLHLIYENFGNKMFIAGQQEHVLEFLGWLYEQTIETLEEQILVLKESKLKQKNNDYQQIEVTFSTFHRMHQSEIFKKANELELICDFAYDVVLVSGFLENLKEFKSFLQEVEASAKKSLYPKYWDFHVVEKFSEIDVLEGTNEFLEVEDLFRKSLNNMRITRLTRIQNKYLMDHFITMLQKRQEFRDEVNMTRKLLFHGSRQVHPQTIYKDSDIGFDLQYSNSGGSYGKGLYFAINSNYSHTYAYNLNNGSFQMFLADVFIGKSTRTGGSGLLKAPAGYDSVESANSFYIVYNNFHSYPLYLIEYTVNNNPPDVYLNQPIVNANVVVNNNNNVIGGGGVPTNVLQRIKNNFNVKPIPQRNIKPVPSLKLVPKSTTKIQNFFSSKGVNESEKKKCQ